MRGGERTAGGGGGWTGPSQGTGRGGRPPDLLLGA